jgi:hypothetical protein
VIENIESLRLKSANKKINQASSHVNIFYSNKHHGWNGV